MALIDTGYAQPAIPPSIDTYDAVTDPETGVMALADPTVIQDLTERALDPSLAETTVDEASV